MFINTNERISILKRLTISLRSVINKYLIIFYEKMKMYKLSKYFIENYENKINTNIVGRFI